MRLRNIKNADELVRKHPLVIDENIFESNIYIEIGCGKGNFIIAMSQKYPNINFIGIEKYPSVLIRALQKLDTIPDNLRFMCLDALNLESVFNSNVEAIYLNFSDPWPKKRQVKRRLTSDTFLKIYENISVSNVELFIKTDNKNLFAYSLESLNNHGYYFKKVSLDLQMSDLNNIMTEYEEKFTTLNIAINYLHATKRVNK